MSLPTLAFVSWEELHQMAIDLAYQIDANHPNLDCIVSVARGGHVLSRVLSDHLKVPIFSVSIQSYRELSQGELVITQELGVPLHGMEVLIADEIVDSGRTLDRAMSYVAHLGAASIVSATLHLKPESPIKATYAARETNDWIVYPYEIRETWETLLPIWQKHGLTAQDLFNHLVSIGMNAESLIPFVDGLVNHRPNKHTK